MRVRRLWVPVLIALMVVGVVGPAEGPATAVEPRVTSRSITIPPAVFQPNSDFDTGFITFLNSGFKLETLSPAFVMILDNAKVFYAPLFFEAQTVTIRRITLYAYDNNPDTSHLPTGPLAGDICVYLYRTVPMGDSQQLMGAVCSAGTGTLVRSFVQSALPIRRINGNYGAYLVLVLPDYSDTGLSFKGVKIAYTY